MTTGSVELRPRSTGEIFALTFNLYRQHFPTFILITSLVLLPALGLNALSVVAVLAASTLAPAAALSGDTQTQDATFTGLTIASNCISAIVWLLGILWPWAEGALAFNVIERVLGRTLGVRASYGQTRRHWASLWIANLLAQIGINLPLIVVYLVLFGGLMAVLAVPVFAVFGADVSAGVPPAAVVATAAICAPIVIGAIVVSVVLAINWAFRAPAIVGEGVDGLQGLRRSAAVARGSRWLIFWRYILLFILEFVVSAAPALIVSSVVLVGVLALMQEATPGNINFNLTVLPGFVAVFMVITAVSVIGSLLLTPFRIVFTTLNYLDLRVRKENLAALLASAAARPAEEPVAAVLAAPPSGAARMPGASPISPQPAPGAPQPSASWQNVDLAKLTPGQRVGVLFNRIRAEGESAHALKELALALKEVGDWGGALDSLTRARAIAPNDPDVAYNLMVLYRERRDMTAARRMMQEYLRLETDPNALAAVRNNPRFKDLLPE
ncbi:MAG: tetratricopeptide repeat protein [Anaerolineae bacterium]|nr:tetratricopeptide repeat protein [Candidatus Roseilinea sp.]MDW8448636.1 tetratricopeptide repeat protein [Anaerolineae bacterium]